MGRHKFLAAVGLVVGLGLSAMPAQALRMSRATAGTGGGAIIDSGVHKIAAPGPP